MRATKLASQRWDHPGLQHKAKATHYLRSLEAVFGEKASARLIMSHPLILELLPRRADYIALAQTYALMEPRSPMLKVFRDGEHLRTIDVPAGRFLVFIPGPESLLIPLSQRDVREMVPLQVVIEWEVEPCLSNLVRLWERHQLLSKARSIMASFIRDLTRTPNQLVRAERSLYTEALGMATLSIATAPVSFPDDMLLRGEWAFPFLALRLWYTLWRHLDSDAAVVKTIATIFPGSATFFMGTPFRRYKRIDNSGTLCVAEHMNFKLDPPLYSECLAIPLVPMFHEFAALQPLFLNDLAHRGSVFPQAFPSRGFYIPSKMCASISIRVALPPHAAPLQNASILSLFVQQSRSWKVQVPVDLSREKSKRLPSRLIEGAMSQHALREFPVLRQES